MSRTTIVIISLVALIVIVGTVLIINQRDQAETVDTNDTNTVETQLSPTPTTSTSPAATASPDATATPTSEATATASPVATTVTYTSSGYSPKNITVAPGTTITFVNQSNAAMWTASDPHPAHTDFSAFDSRKGVANGQSYSYTFAQAGTYGFHNHLNDDHMGTIIVQ